tara:strand:- start:1693 stop:2121 length:429 start_codon:yes stop_codon:yes gene_type:complete
MERILGLDFGNKRIGISISDPSNIFALPHEIYFRQNLDKDIEHINLISESNEIAKIILGLPLSLSGNQNQQTESTIKFKENLENKTTIPIETWDERLTSVQAQRSFEKPKSKKRSKQQKQYIDDVAATIMLQSYLDRQNNKI